MTHASGGLRKISCYGYFHVFSNAGGALRSRYSADEPMPKIKVSRKIFCSGPSCICTTTGNSWRGVEGINGKKINGSTMVPCDACSNDRNLPFTCQNCSGKFYPACRLPPNHQCTVLDSWQKKPSLGRGMRYERRSGASPVSGGYAGIPTGVKVKRDGEIP